MRAPNSATVILLAAVSALAACGASNEDDPSLPPAERGKRLFSQHCATCHQEDGGGSGLAPGLRGKAQHWSRETLIAYLKDPPAYAEKDARLREQGKKYSLPMPTYKMLTEEQLGLLAGHVLSMR